MQKDFTFMILSDPNHLSKAPPPKAAVTLVIGFQHMNSGRTHLFYDIMFLFWKDQSVGSFFPLSSYIAPQF